MWKVHHSKFYETFPGIDLVSIVYGRYCHNISGNWLNKLGCYLVLIYTYMEYLNVLRAKLCQAMNWEE